MRKRGNGLRGLLLSVTLLLSLFLLFTACAKPTETEGLIQKENEDELEARVIYGSDDRLENYQVSEALKTLAAGTVALVEIKDLRSNSQGQTVLSSSTFGASYRLCSSEPFREQVNGAFCSGSLVGSDVVITAGHCITNLADCSKTRFLFDYALKTEGAKEKLSFDQNDVYACQEIIRREQTSTGADYAVIRLDRKVVGRSPLKLRSRSGVVSVGDSLVVIGHPAGLPQKIAGGAKVRSVANTHFVANLDTYGGNSGSAVFNLANGEIEGILVRGDVDFVDQGSCQVSNKCQDNKCRGEDVTRIDVVLPHIPASQPPVDPPVVGQDEVIVSSSSVAIPDSPEAGVSSSLVAKSAVAGRKVQVKIDLTHTYRGDLVVELVSPDNKVVLLHNRAGGSLDDLRGTFGVDLSSAQSLASLSQAPAGQWKLRVSDKAPRDVGVLNSWSLILKK